MGQIKVPFKESQFTQRLYLQCLWQLLYIDIWYNKLWITKPNAPLPRFIIILKYVSSVVCVCGCWYVIVSIDDLNRTHQHCVLAGDMARFSSTHRVAEVSVASTQSPVVLIRPEPSSPFMLNPQTVSLYFWLLSKYLTIICHVPLVLYRNAGLHTETLLRGLGEFTHRPWEEHQEPEVPPPLHPPAHWGHPQRGVYLNKIVSVFEAM